MPLPDLPVLALKRDEALSQGYHPFAGFFLPHEYPMLPNFIKDLEAANREYCIVRDLRYAKGCELFAKNGYTNKIITESPEAIQATETSKQMVSHRNATAEPRSAEGEQEAGDTEPSLREGEEDLARGENP